MEFMKMICAKGNIIKNTKEEVGKNLSSKKCIYF